MQQLKKAADRVARCETLEARKLLSAATLDLDWGQGDPDVPDGVGTIQAFAPNDISVTGLTPLPDGGTLITGRLNSSIGEGIVLRRLADGSPNLNFGTGGEQRYDLLPFGKVLPQADGTFIAMPSASNDDSQPALVRLAADGTLLGPFFDPDSELTGQNQDVEPLSDGGFLLVTYNGLAKINADGTVDTDFGDDGYVVADVIDSARFQSFDAAVQDDGKILVAGEKRTFIQSTDDMGQVRRFNTDGTLDTTFASSGIYEFGTPDFILEQIEIVDVDFTGQTSIVVAGDNRDDGFFADPARDDTVVVRLLMNGTPDPNFSGDGVVLFEGLDVTDIAITPGDGVLLGGLRIPDNQLESTSLMVRVNAFGGIDTVNFGDAGLVTIVDETRVPLSRVLFFLDDVGQAHFATSAYPKFDTFVSGLITGEVSPVGGVDADPITFFDGVQTSSVLGAAVDSNGRPVLTGSFINAFGTAPVARFTDTGLPDTTFDGDGLTLSAGTGSVPTFFDIEVDALNRVVTGGQSRGPFTPDGQSTDIPVVSRFLADGTPDPSFGTDGTVSLSTDLVIPNLIRLDVLSDGSIFAVGTGRDTSVDGNPSRAYVARIGADGTVLLGPTVLALPGSNPVFTEVLALDHGNVLLGGRVNLDGGTRARIVIKLTPTGDFASFGDSGVLLLDQPGSDDEGIARLLADSSGIYAVGNGTDTATFDKQIIVSKFDTSGDLDPSYGTNGTLVVTTSDASDSLRDAVLFDDASEAPGELLVLVNRSTGDDQSVLVRIDATGVVEELETGTNISGIRLLPVGGGRVAVAGRIDGKFATFAVELGQAPQLVQSNFDAEQSAVLNFEFDQPITADAASLSIVNMAGNPLDANNFVATVRGNSIRFTYAPNGGNAPLPSGRYLATLTGVADEPAVLNFTFQAADLDGDLDVDLFDAITLQRNFGRTDDPLYSDGDLDYDGDVDLFDAIALVRNFGTSLPPAAGFRGLFANGPDSLFGDEETAGILKAPADRPRGRLVLDR
ncbi:MAG: hypothetical protein AAGD32_03155 [Planctomycetota bacterium]